MRWTTLRCIVWHGRSDGLHLAGRTAVSARPPHRLATSNYLVPFNSAARTRSAACSVPDGVDHSTPRHGALSGSPVSASHNRKEANSIEFESKTQLGPAVLFLESFLAKTAVHKGRNCYLEIFRFSFFFVFSLQM